MDKFKHPLLGDVIKLNSCGYWVSQARWEHTIEVRLYTEAKCIEPLLNQCSTFLLYVKSQEKLFKKRVMKNSIFSFSNLQSENPEEYERETLSKLSLSSIFIFENQELALLFESQDLFWGSPVVAIFNTKGELLKVELWSLKNKRREPYIHLLKRPS